MKYWVSWYQPSDDPRPLTYPPNEAILAWWHTGCCIEDHECTLVALVEANNVESVQFAVNQDWPEASKWRFINEHPQPFEPSECFPLEPWESERLHKLSQLLN